MPAEGPDDRRSATYTAQMPRSVFTVSVTGHRALPADNGHLREQVDELLSTLRSQCQSVAGDTRLRMISALAAGTDQLLADRALQAGNPAAGLANWELQVVLPFSRTSYRAGLDWRVIPDTTASVARFDRQIEAATSVFELGDLDFWRDGSSGSDARRRLTVTNDREVHRESVARHRQSLVNAVLVPPTMDTGSQAGSSLYSSLSAYAGIQSQSTDGKHGVMGDAAPPCEEMISPNLVKPVQIEPREKSGSVFQKTIRFLRPCWRLPMNIAVVPCWRVFWKCVEPCVNRNVCPEKTRNYSYSFVYQQFQWLMSPGWSDFPGFRLKTDYLKEHWLQGVHPDQARPAFVEAADQVLKVPSVTADTIATSRGHAYRSSYIITFIGAVLAVWVGLMGLFSSENKYWFVGAELLVLACLILFYMFARHRDWHWRWINARHVTESLRGQRLQAWTGFAGRRYVLGAMPIPWTLWFVNATVATVGLQTGTFNRQSARSIAVELKGHVKEQIGWHLSNKHELEHMHGLLDRVGWWCVVAVLGFAALYILVFDPAKCYGWHLCQTYGTGIKYTVTVVCAALPLLAAALAGIRSQGDFERFATRSQETAKELKELDTRLDQLIEKASGDAAGVSAGGLQQPLYEELLECVLDVSHIFETDLADWRYVYLARPSPGPA